MPEPDSPKKPGKSTLRLNPKTGWHSLLGGKRKPPPFLRIRMRSSPHNCNIIMSKKHFRRNLPEKNLLFTQDFTTFASSNKR